MHDAHGDDVMALVRELGEIEFRRGALHAQIDWHLRLRHVAAQAEASRPAVVELEIVRPAAKPSTPRTPRGRLQAGILSYLAEHPSSTARQVAVGIAGNTETTRQALARLVQLGTVTRTMGGSYALAESHAGSGLVAAQG